MKFEKQNDPFKYGFFTQKIDDLFYILYVNPVLCQNARFMINSSFPDYINPNFDLPEIANYEYNSETGEFISDIGNGKFVLTENNQIKVVFTNFRYNNISKLELIFSIKLNHQMGKNPNPNLKI